MKRILLPILLSFFALAASAQESVVTGIVLDPDTKEGEIGAILQFYDSVHDKAIAFTTVAPDGSFSQRLSGRGDFLLVVSNLGRKDLERRFTLDGEDVDLGTMVMVTDAEQLEAAAITAQKVLVKMEIDKMTYNVSEDNDAKASTVLDMLRKVPMVVVDAQDNITVNGSSSFLVTVDGKPNQMLTRSASTAFKMMPASAVKSIEVITNPGAKYDAEGVGGVLNLVTDRTSGGSSSVNDGLYGTVRVSAGRREQAVGGMITAQRGKFSFSLDLDYGHYSMNGQETETDITTAGFLQRTTSTSDMDYPFSMGNFSASYEIDSLNLISASAGLLSFSVKNDGLSEAFAGTAGNLASLYTGTNWMKNGNYDFNASIDYQHSFRNQPGRLLTFSYRLNGSPSSVGSLNTYDPAAAMPGRKMDGTTRSDDHTLQADFTTPLGEKAGTLSTGLKFIFRENTSDQDLFLMTAPSTDWVYDNAGSTNYHFYNRIGAAYAEWNGTFGKWSLKAGARYEHTWQNVYYKQNAGTDFDKDYGVLVPSGSIQYSLGTMQNIGLSYNLRISRPGISYLNPYVNQTDPTHWSQGNTDLDVEKSHSLSLVYNFYNQRFMLSTSLRHSRTGNGISEYTYTDGTILKTTYGNILKQESTGLNIFANLNVGKKARIFANGAVNYTDARNETMGYAKGYWGWSIMGGAQQTLWWDLQLSENLIMMGKRHDLQGYSTGIKAAMVSLTKTFLDDRLSLSLQGVSHLGKGRKMEMQMVSEGHGYSLNTTARVPLREFGFSISWTFGSSGASVRRAERSIQNDDVMEKSSSTPTSATGLGSVGM